jgi:hypothetical protein
VGDTRDRADKGMTRRVKKLLKQKKSHANFRISMIFDRKQSVDLYLLKAKKMKTLLLISPKMCGIFSPKKIPPLLSFSISI